MAKAKKKTDRPSKSYQPKVKNRDKFNRHARSINNISAKHIVGTNCHKADILSDSYANRNNALRYAAIMITGSHSERVRAEEALRKNIK